MDFERGKHTLDMMTCVFCHGESDEHIGVEDNSVKPERSLTEAKDVIALCTGCHPERPDRCEEPPAIDADPEPAPCARCHNPHRAAVWGAEADGQGRRRLRESFGARHARKWSWREGDDWALVEDDGNQVFSLRSMGTAGEKPRRPVSFALWKAGNFSDFELRCRVRCTDDVDRRGRSLVIVFNYIDYKHFYYVHLCNFSDDVHNNLVIVNEEDRKPLLPGGKAPPTLTDDEWHRVRIVRRASDGLIEVYFDDMDTPLHRAFDKTHTWGLIGIGTFHSKGDFDDVMARGELRLPEPTEPQ
ncbi:MAG: hypothetical protein ACE5JM_02620 [Armatimonadota bacterium]